MNRRSGLHRIVPIVLRRLLLFALLRAFTLLFRHPRVQIFLMVSRWGPRLIHRVGRAADGRHGSIAQRPVLDRWILFFEYVREHLYAGTRRRGCCRWNETFYRRFLTHLLIVARVVSCTGRGIKGIIVQRGRHHVNGGGGGDAMGRRHRSFVWHFDYPNRFVTLILR
uniref:Putative secreted protein n=1 Tax=Anopheles darlingi TaxID=43151 RepID=A0A2M4DPL9_ANODA